MDLFIIINYLLTFILNIPAGKWDNKFFRISKYK